MMASTLFIHHQNLRLKYKHSNMQIHENDIG
jgi:hypothetical protein